MPEYSFDAIGPHIGIRRPCSSDCDSFVALAKSSAEFHKPWLAAPATREAFYAYLRARQTPTEDAFLICDRHSNHVMGVINLNCIVRGLFHSAYLGYWIGQPFAGRGFMTEGLQLVTRYAFGEMELHRMEANIQPGDAASIALARRCGFTREGFSPGYLKIFGEWRDHERWALLADDQVER